MRDGRRLIANIGLLLGLGQRSVRWPTSFATLEVTAHVRARGLREG